jgi:hypothetical protein
LLPEDAATALASMVELNRLQMRSQTRPDRLGKRLQIRHYAEDVADLTAALGHKAAGDLFTQTGLRIETRLRGKVESADLGQPTPKGSKLDMADEKVLGAAAACPHRDLRRALSGTLLSAATGVSQLFDRDDILELLLLRWYGSPAFPILGLRFVCGAG